MRMVSSTWHRRDYDDNFLISYGEHKIVRCKNCRRLKLKIQELEDEILKLISNTQNGT